MRPRRTILLIDDNEVRRNVTAFVLESRGRYTVLGCTEDELPYGRGDIELHDLTDSCHMAIVRIDRAEDLCRRLKKSNPEMSVLLIGGEPQARTGSLIDGWLFSDDAQNMPILLERVRIVCARRRGPKKKPAHSVVPAETAAVL